MSKADFRKLLADIKEASFEDDRLSVIETAAKLNFFTSQQVGQLVDAIDFEDGKVKVVQYTAKRIVDLKRSHSILGHFTFSDGKEKAKKILAKVMDE